MRLDSVALNTATGTLPRATAVIATELETVEGSAAEEVESELQVGR